MTGAWLRRALGGLEPYLLSLAGGLLLAAPTLSVQLFWCHWSALVPWTLLATRQPRPAGLHVYLVGLMFYGFVAYRNLLGYGVPAYIIIVALHSPMYLPFYWVLRRLGRSGRAPLVLSVPVAWIAVEWLRSRFVLGGLEISLLAYSHAALPRCIQIADLVGALGVSFVIASLSGVTAEFLGSLRLRPRLGLERPRRVLASAALAAGLVVASLAYGMATIGGQPLEAGPRVTIVQPHLDHHSVPAAGVMLGQLVETRRSVPAGSTDLVVWPEYAVLDFLDGEPPYRADLEWLARELKADLLVGAYGHAPGDRAAIANTALLIDHDGAPNERYDKVFLIPGTEYIPGTELLGRLHRDLPKLARRVAEGAGFAGVGVPARSIRTLTWHGPHGDMTLGTPLCSEGMIEEVSRSMVAAGARVLINPTSEGRASYETKRMVLAASILRAVENRVPFVRAGNDGISCVIDASGRMVGVLRGERDGGLMEAGTLTLEVPLDRRTRSLYTRTGPILGVLCLVASALVLAPRRLSFHWLRPSLRLAALGGAALAGAAAVASRAPGPQAPASVRRAEADIAAGEGKKQFEHGLDLVGLRRLRRALEVYPDHALAAQYVAELCRKNRWHAEGYATLSRARERGGDGPELLEALAYFAYMLDRHSEALARVDEALALAPGASGSRLLKAEIHAADGDPPAAAAVLREGLLQRPASAALRRRLAYYELVAGRLDAAEETLRPLLAAEAPDAAALGLLGRIRLEGGDSAGAIELLGRATELEPADPMLLYELGRAQLRGQDLRGARLSAEKSVARRARPVRRGAEAAETGGAEPETDAGS